MYFLKANEQIFKLNMKEKETYFIKGKTEKKRKQKQKTENAILVFLSVH